jgi:hypothetical protein
MTAAKAAQISAAMSTGTIIDTGPVPNVPT